MVEGPYPIHYPPRCSKCGSCRTQPAERYKFVQVRVCRKCRHRFGVRLADYAVQELDADARACPAPPPKPVEPPTPAPPPETPAEPQPAQRKKRRRR